MKQFQKFINNRKQPQSAPFLNKKLAKKQQIGNAEDFSQFYCFKKNIPSLLLRLPQSELNKQAETYEHFLENQSDSSEESSSRSESDEYGYEDYYDERKESRQSKRKTKTQRRADKMFQKQREA